MDGQTGFISDDEDSQNVANPDKKETHYLSWLNDFNIKMLNAAIAVDTNPDNRGKFYSMINRQSEIVRKKSKSDPTARGARKYKPLLRKLLGTADTLNVK